MKQNISTFHGLNKDNAKKIFIPSLVLNITKQHKTCEILSWLYWMFQSQFTPVSLNICTAGTSFPVVVVMNCPVVVYYMFCKLVTRFLCPGEHFTKWRQLPLYITHT